MGLTRRLCLAGLGLAAAWPAVALARPGTRIAASWREEDSFRLGVLEASAGALRVTHSLELPTRAHGLLQQADGCLLAVARRPGDWLLRWHIGGGRAEWHWMEGARSFNGHVAASPDGQRLFTTETDAETGQGFVGVRDAGSLRLLDAWPTHGPDPHELSFDQGGSLLVANGGIVTLPETGRAKLHLDRMDSSLVRLDGRSGALAGQWRLADRRLSLRHLAWSAGAGPRMLAIALQAEHEDAGARAAAPVLALFDGRELRTAQAPVPLAGYGGDVAATAGGFAVSCPRRDAVALFSRKGAWAGQLSAASACALATDPAGLWVGGRREALQSTRDGPRRFSCALELDNHWLMLG